MMKELPSEFSPVRRLERQPASSFREFVQPITARLLGRLIHDQAQFQSSLLCKQKRSLMRTMLRLTALFGIACWGTSAMAQSAGAPFPVIPTMNVVDRNRVNVTSGMPQLTGANIVIGSDQGGLDTKKFTKNQVGFYGEVPWLWSEQTSGYILVHVLTNEKYHTFLVGVTQAGGQFIPFTNQITPGTYSPGVYFENGVGNALLSCVGNMVQLYGNGVCTVIEGDGEQTEFSMSNANLTVFGYSYPTGLATKTTKPDNEILTYSYKVYPTDYYKPSTGGHLTSISSSLGFMLKMATAECYSNGTCDDADAINTSFDYCDPVNGCALSNNAIRGKFSGGTLSVNGIPLITYTNLPYSFIFEVTDYVNSPTYFNNTPASNPLINEYYGIYSFNSSSPLGVSNTYSLTQINNGCASNFNDCSLNLAVTGASAANYLITYGPSNDPSRPISLLVTNPDGSSVLNNMTSGTLVKRTDELGRVNTYQYSGGVTYYSITGPPALGRAYLADSIDVNHGYTQYNYTNGTFSGTTVVPNDGSASLVTQLGITLTCGPTNYKICNKPQYMIDPKGNRTDYTYDTQHGGMLTETLPADANGVRGQRRYTYSQLTPKILNASGVLVNSTPVWRKTRQSECISATSSNPASCVGTAAEKVTTYAYNNNNLFLTSATNALGDGSQSRTETYTYDYVGNITSTKGPRIDIDDTSYRAYDVLRRAVFEIGADPDGAGPLPRQVTHHVFDADGNEIRTETGTGVATNGSDFQIIKFIRRTFDPVTGLLAKVEEVQP